MSKAIISIKGTQIIDEEPNVIEFITDGIYTCNEAGKRITYFETELTGEKGVKNVINVQDDTIIITKNGPYKTQLILENGKRHHCPYNTPFGMMTMGINTQEINDGLTKQGGNLFVSYELEINHNTASVNKLEITVKESKKDAQKNNKSDRSC
ncbi:MAG: DUF1934 domain-containing protein [Ruminococcaceae bacterium]|nr:DUF1934 domain-containing protein [Oscillospiraceae bacterium]